MVPERYEHRSKRERHRFRLPDRAPLRHPYVFGHDRKETVVSESQTPLGARTYYRNVTASLAFSQESAIRITKGEPRLTRQGRTGSQSAPGMATRNTAAPRAFLPSWPSAIHALLTRDPPNTGDKLQGPRPAWPSRIHPLVRRRFDPSATARWRAASCSRYRV